MTLQLRPITLKAAIPWVRSHHRHQNLIGLLAYEDFMRLQGLGQAVFDDTDHGNAFVTHAFANGLRHEDLGGGRFGHVACLFASGKVTISGLLKQRGEK